MIARNSGQAFKGKPKDKDDRGIIGELLAANNNEISGWAFVPKSQKMNQADLFITIMINGTLATQVHADRRSYNKMTADGEQACGFRLDIHESLLKSLPLENHIEARLPDGTALPFASNYQCNVVGHDGVDKDELPKLLNEGRTVAAKSGMLLRTIAQRKGWDNLVLETYLEAEDLFRTIIGRDLFIGYGTLLGLVRDGKLIGHDDDVDAMFLLQSETAEEAGREFVDIANALKQARQNIVNIYPGGNFHWGLPKNILLDIFGCWICDGEITGYMFSFEGGKADILPVKREDLCGISVLVPAKPEKFLEGTYGKNWHIPDPYFQWQPNEKMLQKMSDFGRGVLSEQ